MQTAFPEIERILAPQIREAALDHEAFAMPLRVCQLENCRATCCHDGVHLSPHEAETISQLVSDNRDLLKDYDWQHEDFLTEKKGEPHSITLPVSDTDLPENFPSHFPKTRCIFLDEKHRCVLQRLSMDHDQHPWFWKPVSCWLFPLILRAPQRGERPVLTLATPDNDPTAKPDYAGFSSCSPCGIAKDGAPPAWETLREELTLLGKIGDRDLLKELSPF